MDREIDRFCADGFVVVRGAVAPDIVRSCVVVIEEQLRARGVDARDPATWTDPVVRIDTPFGPSFTAAGASPALYEVYDALLGPDRWVKKEGVGGTLPVRFPSTRDPGDAGWHIDNSYRVDGGSRVNVHSRGRGLLALFLFTDVGEDDAPTELIVGSHLDHLDVPRLLAPFGEQGAPGLGELPASTFERPRAFATGRAGDVFVCHPFIVHRATWPHRGSGPRMVAQPEVPLLEPFALRPGAATCAVEHTILQAHESK